MGPRGKPTTLIILLNEHSIKMIPFLIVFLRQSFSVALEPALKLALVDQDGLELIEILLPLPPKHWD